MWPLSTRGEEEGLRGRTTKKKNYIFAASLSNLEEIDLMALTNSINATKAMNPRTANRALRAILQPTLCFCKDIELCHCIIGRQLAYIRYIGIQQKGAGEIKKERECIYSQVFPL